MKIEFKEESNKLIITKTSFEELKKIKKREFMVIYFFRVLIYIFYSNNMFG